jgi:hypothetical protein
MKWTLVSTSPNGIKEYRLEKEAQVLLVMKYSAEQQSVRIKMEKEHLIFLLESANGITGQRICFTNGYGVELGKFSFNRNGSGNLQINDQLFHYTIVNEERKPSLIIYKRSKAQPLAVCHWPAIPHPESVPYEYACLILGVCWQFVDQLVG